MNAAETIAKAIEKLELLQADSAPGPWHHWPEAGEIEIYSDHVEQAGQEFVVATSVRPRLGWSGPIYAANYEPTAELIVTLHRSIDAQLAILRHAVGIYNISVRATQRPPHGVDDEGGIFYRKPEKAAENAAYHVRHALALATAIPGGDQ